MKNKKILARIIAVFACVLIVCTFTISAFADDFVQGTITPDVYTAFVDHGITPTKLSATFTELVDAYRRGKVRNAGLNGLFDCEVMYINDASDGYTRPSIFSKFSLQDGSGITYKLDCEYLVMDICYNNGISGMVNDVISNSDVDISLSLAVEGDDAYCDVWIEFNDDYNSGEYTRIVLAYQGIVYPSTIEFYLKNVSIYYETQDIDIFISENSIEYIDFCFTLEDNIIIGADISGLDAFSSIVCGFGVSSRVHPRAFANGYLAGIAGDAGYNEGYELGYEQGIEFGFVDGLNSGFQQGKTEGLDIGYETGYDTGYSEGYDKGLASGDGGAGYDKGYQDAVADIDSGKFGENFLGNIFSAPVKALNSFTLVTTPNGVNITLGGLLACVISLTLFFALIKMLGR